MNKLRQVANVTMTIHIHVLLQILTGKKLQQIVRDFHAHSLTEHLTCLSVAP